MEDNAAPLELFRLTGESGTDGVTVRVRGRYRPEEYDDLLDAEIVVHSAVSGQFRVILFPEDLDEWDGALEEFAAGGAAGWLGERQLTMHVEPVRGTSCVKVRIHADPVTGIDLSLPLLPAATWVGDNRARFDRVRAAYPEADGGGDGPG
ncbi:DUF5959 family protein [Marinitenerispora sediminis]|uniref:Uncharacterized protein n=1 Tax=Marinitenerispora sediminis TaxID=1931232 RepID=A0A368T5X4_9ACTN|nr:DUF5959 family protein [Marinitenerispora sediminis]RCV51711.1 hypothetical protein DEF28_14775 [Marinitenerispora sediminis]RCV55094.1 hypothetical protein DEF23_14760 [Marinitenerispora sediminis]RCV59091.1 hypothetical protein DEF24_11085 [Marinitenerispora sediminis]